MNYFQPTADVIADAIYENDFKAFEVVLCKLKQSMYEESHWARMYGGAKRAGNRDFILKLSALIADVEVIRQVCIDCIFEEHQL